MAPKILGFVPPQGSAERTKILRLRVRGITVSVFIFAVIFDPMNAKSDFMNACNRKVP
jgi:hypothetical protein